jgi:hypothetical protein
MAASVRPGIHDEYDQFVRTNPYLKPKSRLKNIFDSIVDAFSTIANKISSSCSSLKGRVSQLRGRVSKFFEKPKETFDFNFSNDDIMSGGSIDSQAYTQNQPKRQREQRNEQALNVVCTIAVLATGVAGAVLFVKDLFSKN